MPGEGWRKGCPSHPQCSQSLWRTSSSLLKILYSFFSFLFYFSKDSWIAHTEWLETIGNSSAYLYAPIHTICRQQWPAHRPRNVWFAARSGYTHKETDLWWLMRWVQITAHGTSYLAITRWTRSCLPGNVTSFQLVQFPHALATCPGSSPALGHQIQGLLCYLSEPGPSWEAPVILASAAAWWIIYLSVWWLLLHPQP